MDVTNVFKACVKMVKTRSKALGVENDVLKRPTDILNKYKEKSNIFNSKAKEIVATISKLHEFIAKNRQAYINVDQLWDSPNMENYERDQIDSDAQTVMKTCSHVIREFKQNFQQQSCTDQVREHQQFVVFMIESYLKAVCEMYSEQRAIRVKRTIERQKMNSLELKNKRIKMDTSAVSTSPDDSDTKRSDSESMASPSSVWKAIEDDQDLVATPEEIQMFEQENQKLYDDLATLSDEVRHIEGQVMEISKLQQIFTNKILEQDQSLDVIADTVMHTNENIKTANEDIREAMKKNASFRAWILFFLIVISFSLLFLDWYNN